MPPLTLADVRIQGRLWLVNRVLSLPVFPSRLRPRLLRALRLRVLSAEIGSSFHTDTQYFDFAEGTIIGRRVSLRGPGAVRVAPGVRVGDFAVIDTRVARRGEIVIAENVEVNSDLRARSVVRGTDFNA